jgi:hypothetical protein
LLRHRGGTAGFVKSLALAAIAAAGLLMFLLAMPQTKGITQCPSPK